MGAHETFLRDEEADLTPFVEVLMVLMATFVVLVAFQIHGIGSELVSAEAGRPQLADQKSVIVEITAEDVYEFDGESIDVENLKEHLILLSKDESGLVVHIAEDYQATCGAALKLKVALADIPNIQVMELYRPDSR